MKFTDVIQKNRRKGDCNLSRVIQLFASLLSELYSDLSKTFREYQKTNKWKVSLYNVKFDFRRLSPNRNAMIIECHISNFDSNVNEECCIEIGNKIRTLVQTSELGKNYDNWMFGINLFINEKLDSTFDKLFYIPKVAEEQGNPWDDRFEIDREMAKIEDNC